MTLLPKESHLLTALKPRLRGCVVVAGVGNMLRGDDGAGPLLVEMLQKRLPANGDSPSRIHLVNCGTAPENYIGRISRLRPDTVVVVDSAAAGLVPGELRILETDELSKRAVSTHEISPALFMRRLKEESGADVFLAAIQPKTQVLGKSLSDPVTRSLAELCNLIMDVLRLNQPCEIRRPPATSTSLPPPNLAP